MESNPSTGASAGLLFRFINEDMDTIESFTTNNLPIPEEGEEIYLSDMDIYESEEEGDELDVVSESMYKVVSIVKQYSKFTVINPNSETEVENSPVLIVDIGVEEVEEEEGSEEEEVL